MKNKALLFFLQLFIFTSGYSLAQVNNDSIFESAIQASRKKQYSLAIKSSNEILKREPQRADILVFIANNFAWNHQLDSAQTYINKAYKIDPKSSELYDSWLNILLWNKEYNRLLNTCEDARSNGYSNNYNLLKKEALANNALENYSLTTDLIEHKDNALFFDSLAIQNIYQEALISSKPRLVSFFYAIDLFDSNISHFAYFDYTFNINQNKLILRLNYANRFNTNGTQLEADYYTKFDNHSYLYLNYGYAIDNILFPQHRAGAEYYFPLLEKTNASFGARYLRFNSNNVTIATGHISQYISNYWVALRPFYAMQKSGNSFAIVNTYRKYLSSDLSYWGLEFGYGNSPEERATLTQSNNYLRLTSYKIKLERNLLVRKTNELRIGVTIASEEANKNNYKGRYTLELMYKLRHK